MPSYGYDPVAGTWTAPPELPPTNNFDSIAKGLPFAWWYLNLTLPTGVMDQQPMTIIGEPGALAFRDYTNTDASVLTMTTGDLAVWETSANRWTILQRVVPGNLPIAISRGAVATWYYLNLTLPTGVYGDQLLIILGEGTASTDRVYNQPAGGAGGTISLRNGDHCAWVVASKTWILLTRLK